MVVSLEEMKSYLRVDDADEDELIETLIFSAEKLCMDILRIKSVKRLEKFKISKVAVLYAAAYLFEHREEAEHHALTLTLRALLSGERKEVF